MVILEEQHWLKECSHSAAIFFQVYFWWTYPRLFGDVKNPPYGFGGLAHNCYVFVLGD